MAKLLDDARPAVRRRAIATLATRADSGLAAAAKVLGAITQIVEAGPSVERRNAVWTATRIDHSDARGLVRKALRDADDTVRQVALHSISLWRDRNAVPDLLALLQKPSPQNRRAAAEALGRIGDKTAVPALLAAVGEPSDRFLEHSLTFALIEIADKDGTAAGLKSTNPLVQRAALIALDQMDGGGLDAKTVATEVASTNPLLKETATWIVGRHPTWGGELAGLLRKRLATKEPTAAEREELSTMLARFAGTPAIQDLITGCLHNAKESPAACRTALCAIAKTSLKAAPAPWLAGLTEVLVAGDAETKREAIAAVRALPLAKMRPEALANALLRIGAAPKEPESVRLAALAAVPGGLTGLTPELFDFLRRPSR